METMFIVMMVAGDCLWQQYWTCISQVKTDCYTIPTRTIGQQFLQMLTMKFRGICNHLWNPKKSLVFPAVVLQKAHGCTATLDIK